VVELTDDALLRLALGVGGPRVHAVVLVGSLARGDADAYSDVDLKCFVERGAEKPRDWFGHRGGRLVTVFSGPVQERLDELRHPRSAVWAVPTWRDMRVLLDREGEAERLRQAARAFDWAAVDPPADEFVAHGLVYLGEWALKLVGALVAGDAERAVGPTWELANELGIAMAVHRRLHVASERRFASAVRAALGEGSEWSTLQRVALGVDPGDWAARGVAALGLYWETARLLRPLLPADWAEAVDGVVARIEQDVN
jgi:hypothetical protein